MAEPEPIALASELAPAPDAKLPTTVCELYRQGRRAACGGLILTLSLGVAKLVGGWAGHSFALLADSVHSFGDALASAGVLGALVWAERPPDREHPYGHTRIEAIAALIVAMLLVLSGAWIGWAAIGRWNEPAPVPHWYTIAIALASALLNEALFHYSRGVARRTGSKAVLASAWDQRMDAFGSLVVLISLFVSSWGGASLRGADQFAAIIVGGIILWSGANLFWGSLQELMDRQAEPEVIDAIRREALATPGVRGVEKILVRKTGLEFLVDLHVEVDPTITVNEGHNISHAVKDRLMTKLITVKHVLIHIEPSRDR